MAELVTIFISHKMPKDSDTTSSIGQLIATHSGNKIKINLAEDFRKGSQLSSDITKAIQTADIFLLLYTGEDQDWGYCLLEAGQFQASLGSDAKRSIVVFHDPDISVPQALSEFISVPITENPVFEFLKQLYVDTGVFPDVNPDSLLDTAKKICEAFHRTDVLAINFDLVPNFTVEFENSDENTQMLKNERVPDRAFLKGSLDWQLLFGKDAATGAWVWEDLSRNWVGGDLYAPELARMMKTAKEKNTPEGFFMRPHDTTELHRLTLRRYEEIDNASRLKFYFTAALIDIPIFGINDTADREELTLYNMINATWYARRRLIDQLYIQLLSYVNSVQDDPARVSDIVTAIKNELRNIDIQASIRKISRPMDVNDVVSLPDRNTSLPIISLPELISDQRVWEQHRAEIFEYSNKTPMDLKGMTVSLYEMAKINQKYYEISAAKYAETAQRLELPPAPLLDALGKTVTGH
jgi:hypothetical protein